MRFRADALQSITDALKGIFRAPFPQSPGLGNRRSGKAETKAFFP